jgi:hypothetical protein
VLLHKWPADTCQRGNIMPAQFNRDGHNSNCRNCFLRCCHRRTDRGADSIANSFSSNVQADCHANSRTFISADSRSVHSAKRCTNERTFWHADGWSIGGTDVGTKPLAECGPICDTYCCAVRCTNCRSIRSTNCSTNGGSICKSNHGSPNSASYASPYKYPVVRADLSAFAESNARTVQRAVTCSDSRSEHITDDIASDQFAECCPF